MWKVIPKEPFGKSKVIFEINEEGRVRKLLYYERSYSPDFSNKKVAKYQRCSGHTIRYLKPQMKNGKLQIALAADPYTPVVDLVLNIFVGPKPEGYEIRQLNGNVLDCRLENLTYSPISDTNLPRRRGRLTQEEKNSILLQLQTIRRHFKTGNRGKVIAQLAAYYGVNPATIYRLNR